MKQFFTLSIENGSRMHRLWPNIDPLKMGTHNRALVAKTSRKLFTLLAFLISVGVGTVFGQTQFATTSVTTTSSPYTVACTKSSGSTAPNASYGSFVRCYANNKITISTASGNPNIREIHIVWSKNSSKTFASVSAGAGSYTHPSGAGTGIWTGNASSVEFTVGSSGQVQIVSVTIYTCAKPSAVAKGTVTSSSFGLTITDAANTNNYEVYFNTSSTAPSISATVSATVTSKTPTISSDVAASTTYYVWVRSKCSATSKSAWVALTGNTLTTSAASCSANPTIGNASLNGSFFWTTLFEPVRPCVGPHEAHCDYYVVFTWLSRIMNHLIYTLYISCDFEISINLFNMSMFN